MRLFAALRERAGAPEIVLELPEGASVQDALERLSGVTGDVPAVMAINREYAERTTALHEGDEVALIPPVSGGAFRLTDRPIDPSAVIREVSDPHAGGIATFIGTTRVQSRGRTVHYLDYEAYGGMAEAVMAELADELKRRHELCEVAIHHRTGRVDIGGVSVVIAVSAPHRAAALAACKEAIDTLKETVPLWKKEVCEGGAEWIGRGS